MESELCHLVYVAQVEICGDGIDSGGMDVPMTGHTELPTCTVCLERMDESVDGILTILCNHSFHGSCLAKWGDTTWVVTKAKSVLMWSEYSCILRCPVCRYLQSPEVSADSFCSECKSVESLWICLICGHVGCGRYVGGHAHKYIHFNSPYCYNILTGSPSIIVISWRRSTAMRCSWATVVFGIMSETISFTDSSKTKLTASWSK